MNMLYRYYKLWVVICLLIFSCKADPKVEILVISKPSDYIRKIPGENDSIPEELAQKGKVLVAYSDCYTCHKIDSRSKGPAFQDIASRYPVQEGYVDMLASRVIAGGSGAWGSPVMLPHADVPHEEAKKMVYYILSLKEEM